MPAAAADISQGWLMHQQLPIDSFFGGAAPSLSTNRNVKRKRGGKDTVAKDDAPAKKLRTFNAKDRRTKEFNSTSVKEARVVSSNSITISKAKARSRPALGDVTPLQNSPRLHSRNHEGWSERRGFLFASPSQRSPRRVKGKEVKSEVIQASDSSDDELLTSPSSIFGPTPSRPPKLQLGWMKGNLPSPPSSGIVSSKANAKGLMLESSPVPFGRLAFGRSTGQVAQTPFTYSSALQKQSYPTPESVYVPRLKFPMTESSSHPRSALPALPANVELPPPSSLFSSITKNDEMTESTDEGNNAQLNEVPPSQTQYLAYSPKKKPLFPVGRFKPSSTTVILSSQSSQPSVMSPRKVRKPAPLSTQRAACMGTENRDDNKLNYVVPTSQEDEVEISLLDAMAPHLSQMLKTATSDAKENAPRREVESGVPELSAPPNAQSWTLKSKSDAIISVSPVEALSERQPEDEILVVASQSQGQHGPPRNKVEAQTEGSNSAPNTLIRGLFAMLDDLDRLADEARGHLAQWRLPSRKTPRSHLHTAILATSGEVEKFRDNLDFPEATNIESQTGSKTQPDSQSVHVLVQSSMTEPDSWDEDPFASTNRTYMAHLGLLSSSRQRMNQLSTDIANDEKESGSDPFGASTCTQSSATQADTDDEDPFPTLPPVSTADSTGDKTAAQAMLFTSQEQDSHKEGMLRGQPSQRELPPTSPSQSQRWSQLQSQSPSQSLLTPCIGSFDDSFDVTMISPRRVRGALRDRFRRPDRKSFLLAEDGAFGDDKHNHHDGELESEESMPSVVRDFLGMFDSQTQDRSYVVVRSS